MCIRSRSGRPGRRTGPVRERSGDCHARNLNRGLRRPRIEYFGLRDPVRGEDVHRLRHGRGVHGTDRIVGRYRRRGADTELERLRRRLETAGAVAGEAVLTGEHDGETPTRSWCSTQRGGRHGKGDVSGDVGGLDPDEAQRVGYGGAVDKALPEALHLDQPVPGSIQRVVTGRERRRCRVSHDCRIGDVDVDQLGAERAAERLRQVRGLHPEDDVRAVVVDLEVPQVVGARLEIGCRRVGVRAGAVVVTGRVGEVENQGARDDVVDDGALREAGCPVRGGRDHGEHRRTNRRRDGERERSVHPGDRRPDDGVTAAVGVDGVHIHRRVRRGAPGDRHRLAADDGAVGRRGEGQRGAGLGVLEVPPGGVHRLFGDPAGADVRGQPDELRRRPGQRGGAADGLPVLEADRRAFGCGAEGRGGQIGVLPGLFGDQPDAGRGAGHACPQIHGLGAVPGGDLVLGPLAGQDRPEVPGAAPRGLRRIGAVARPGLALVGAGRRVADVAVAVPVLGARCVDAVAVEALPAGGGAADHLVDQRQGTGDRRIVGGQHAQPRQFQETGIQHGPLIGVRSAVAQVVADRGVRIAGLGQPDEERLAGVQRSAGRHGPGLDHPLVLIGGAAVDPRAGGVAVAVGDRTRRRQAGDLRRNGGRRIALLLLPALVPEGRAVRDHVVGGPLDVRQVERVVGQPDGAGHQDRVGDLVELHPERIGRRFAVHQAVARHRPVGLLLPLEQEPDGVPRGRDVTGGDQPGERLVEVAGEDLAIGTEVGVGRVAGLHGLPPRAGQ